MNKPVKWEKPNIVFAGLSKNNLKPQPTKSERDKWMDMFNSERNFPT